MLNYQFNKVSHWKPFSEHHPNSCVEENDPDGCSIARAGAGSMAHSSISAGEGSKDGCFWQRIPSLSASFPLSCSIPRVWCARAQFCKSEENSIVSWSCVLSVSGCGGTVNRIYLLLCFSKRMVWTIVITKCFSGLVCCQVSTLWRLSMCTLTQEKWWGLQT